MGFWRDVKSIASVESLRLCRYSLAHAAIGEADCKESSRKLAMFIRSHFSGCEVESRCPNGKRPNSTGVVCLVPHWMVGEKVAVCISASSQSCDLIARGAPYVPRTAVAALILEHIQPRQFGSSENHL